MFSLQFRDKWKMILSVSTLVTLTFLYGSVIVSKGEKCTEGIGKSGYCREKEECLRNSGKKNCPNGFVCCEVSATSGERCKEYEKYVLKESLNVALSARILVHNESECSLEAVPLIVGGEKAKEKEFPHMAAIGYGREIRKAVWLCGGSLISENYILSAAHCSESAGRGPAAFVRVGTRNLKNRNPYTQDITIEKRINHPKYRPPSRYYDIAVFKLSQPVKMNAYVRPACLHFTPDEFSLKKATATGWGKLNYNDNEGTEELMKVALTLIDYSKCNSSFSGEVGGKFLRRGILRSQVCAGELEGGKDTCQGDSGGPLQVVVKDSRCMYSVIGVTSFGKFCGFRNAPAVYTRVSYFVPWIEALVWP